MVAASPKSGINTITGDGLKEAMADTQAVGDPREVVSDPEAEYFGSRSRSARWCHWQGAPRSHRSRRMAPPPTGKSLILHPRTEGDAP